MKKKKMRNRYGEKGLRTIPREEEGRKTRLQSYDEKKKNKKEKKPSSSSSTEARDETQIYDVEIEETNSYGRKRVSVLRQQRRKREIRDQS